MTNQETVKEIVDRFDEYGDYFKQPQVFPTCNDTWFIGNVVGDHSIRCGKPKGHAGHHSSRNAHTGCTTIWMRTGWGHIPAARRLYEEAHEFVDD